MHSELWLIVCQFSSFDGITILSVTTKWFCVISTDCCVKNILHSFSSGFCIIKYFVTKSHVHTFWNHYWCEIWIRIHRLHALYKCDNGELLFSVEIVRQYFRKADFSQRLLPHPNPKQRHAPHITHVHTFTLAHAHTENTMRCASRCSHRNSSLTPYSSRPWTWERSHDSSFAETYRQTDAVLVCGFPSLRSAWMLLGSCYLPVKEFYKIGFAHWRCSVGESWYSNDSIESSGLSCPLRYQFNHTSAFQVDIFAGMQTILYLPYNILSALLYLSQFT